MKIKVSDIKILFLLNIYTIAFYGQHIPLPQSNKGNGIQNYMHMESHTPKIPDAMDIFWSTENQNSIQTKNQQIINDIEQAEIIRNQNQKISAQTNRDNVDISYKLSSFSKARGTDVYYKAFDVLQNTDTADFSIRDINFIVENAFYENEYDQEEFNKHIKNSGDFIRAKMAELSYDINSNSAKNYMLFQFFVDTLRLKSDNELSHLPFQYDFDDYTGSKDWTKMFVTKLLETQTGQCHSMPLLYLILAEEIGAEAYLSVSPNHTYIRFPDDKGKWYNIELTNGMFSTTSYILQSGYIKSEALRNKIYMQNLSRKELLAHFYVDLVGGYMRKYGYDEFTATVIDKALELYPNSINANMHKSNIETIRFEQVMQKLDINPRDHVDLQNIRYYPKAVQLLNKVNKQYAIIDNLGYEHMPAEAYQNWLQSMKEEQQKRDSETIKKQFNGLLINLN